MTGGMVEGSGEGQEGGGWRRSLNEPPVSNIQMDANHQKKCSPEKDSSNRRPHEEEERGSDSESGNFLLLSAPWKCRGGLDPASKSSLIGEMLNQVFWGSRSFNQKD